MTIMTTHPEHLLARAADGAALSESERRDLELHLEACLACREAAGAQRRVARALHARADAVAAPDFASRLSARIDADGGGILDLANWRAWTVGLVPVAAALVLVAYLGAGTTTSGTITATTETATFETWAASSAGSGAAAVFLQPSASGDQLLETVLTGAAPSGTESSNVR